MSTRVEEPLDIEGEVVMSNRDGATAMTLGACACTIFFEIAMYILC
jgi:hypothetical protein